VSNTRFGYLLLLIVLLYSLSNIARKQYINTENIVNEIQKLRIKSYQTGKSQNREQSSILIRQEKVTKARHQLDNIFQDPSAKYIPFFRQNLELILECLRGLSGEEVAMLAKYYVNRNGFTQYRFELQNLFAALYPEEVLRSFVEDENSLEGDLYSSLVEMTHLDPYFALHLTRKFENQSLRIMI